MIKLDKSSEPLSDSSIVELDFHTDRGKILGYGRNIFMGYLNRENDAKELVTSDNWLRLGDTGLIDEDGFLVITGYSPDLIILASGEKINPTFVEDRVRMELPCVSHCLLVGQGREKLGLLLTLDTVVDSETDLPTSQLSKSCKRWFKSARFTVKTVEDVIQGIEGTGIKHVIQVNIQ